MRIARSRDTVNYLCDYLSMLCSLLSGWPSSWPLCCTTSHPAGWPAGLGQEVVCHERCRVTLRSEPNMVLLLCRPLLLLIFDVPLAQRTRMSEDVWNASATKGIRDSRQEPEDAKWEKDDLNYKQRHI